jgi:hypothetical protein
MTKKDYQVIAEGLAHARPEGGDPAYHIWFTAVEAVCARLALENPRFRQDIFVRACHQ